MHKSGTALAAAALLATTACGAGGGGRPSADDISETLQQGSSASDLGLTGKLPDKAADCIAKALVDSKVSDKALRSIVDADKNYKLSKKDEKALAPAFADLRECVASLS